MPHARQHAETRTRERRHRLAHEAARLMVESGIRDFQQAKRKAAHRLGIHEDAALPRNRDIQDAMRSYQRLFGTLPSAALLREKRRAALQAMEFFAPFSPRLAGPLVDDDGPVDDATLIQLHLHGDDPQALATCLHDHGIPARARVRRLRLDAQRTLDVDVWSLQADDQAFELVMLPSQALRQAPLSPLDDKPMPRCSAAQLRQRLAAQDTGLSG